MTDSDPTLLVDTGWLDRHLGDPGLTVLDASWYLPQDRRDPKAEFTGAHIPGARYFDIDAIADPDTDLPHMVPTPEAFAEAVSKMGISTGDQVVVYDTAGLMAAPRVWWTFRLFGHDRVAVLDGGFPKWQREGRGVETGITPCPPGRFAAGFRPGLCADMAAVTAASRTGDPQIADARGPARFRGEAPEPREGLAQGRIPGSRNVFFADLVRSDGTVTDAAEIRRLFADAGIDLSRPVITSCGSGITAAVLSFGLELIGHRAHALYDGSFAEWGQPGKGGIETG